MFSLNMEYLWQVLLELFAVLCYFIAIVAIIGYSIDLILLDKRLFNNNKLNYLAGFIGLVIYIALIIFFVNTVNNQIDIIIERYTIDDSEIFRSR